MAPDTCNNDDKNDVFREITVRSRDVKQDGVVGAPYCCTEQMS